MLILWGCHFNAQLKKPAPDKINTETEHIDEPLSKENFTSEKQQIENNQLEKQQLDKNQLNLQSKMLLKKKTSLKPIRRKTDPILPWDKNPKFLKVQIKNNTPKLIASFHITLPEPFMSERTNITLAANKLKGAVVMPGQIFSLNKRIGKRTVPEGFKMGPMILNKKKTKTIGGGVCKVATVMYNVAVLANQKIVERHPHTKKSPYIRSGQDATLDYESKDLKFQNTTSSPILIWSQSVGDTLYIALYGNYTPPKITWKHHVERKSGIKKVHSWIIIKNGKKKKIKDMGISKYYLKK